jgi:hypothetical protein
MESLRGGLESRGRRARTQGGALLLAGFVLGTGTVRAQLNSDVVPVLRIVPSKVQVDTDLANSRFHLGPIRLLPSFDVSDAGYNSNVFGRTDNPVGDWTATVNAGTRLILPLGSKFYFLGDIFPGYTWYATYTDLSNFTGTAGAGFAGYFNRLTFEAGARGTEAIVVHSEVPSPTLAKTVHVFAKTDVDLGSGLAVFVDAEGLKVEETQQGVPLQDRSQVARYNRTDEALGGGVRYTIGSWTFAPEVQYTTTDFVIQPDQRNNKSIGYLLGVNFNRPRFYLNLVGGYREGDPWEGSTFPHYATPVGSYFLSYFIRPWLELRSAGSRRISYSVVVTNPYYYAMQIGGSINVQVHPRILLKAVGDVGQHWYPIQQEVTEIPPTAPQFVNRLDKLSAYGGGASVILSNHLTLTAIVTQKMDVSNIPSHSYSYLQYSTFLSFTGEFMR